jgi:hypothetical protein
MRGTILGFDAASGEGVINDLSGGRYKFSRDEWKSPGDPFAGRLVDFETDGDRATAIFLVPGSGNPLNFSMGDDDAKSAMTSGIISIVCAIASFVVGPLAIFTLVASIVFGIKGKNAGANLPDKTAYYLSLAGLIISAIILIGFVLLLAMCGAALVSVPFWLH